jgi:CDP-diacylglycerol--serine O-phosphatidyltransferase
LTVILVGSLIFLIWNYSQAVLLIIPTAYVVSGIAIRIGGIVRRHLRRTPPQRAEHQIG